MGIMDLHVGNVFSSNGGCSCGICEGMRLQEEMKMDGQEKLGGVKNDSGKPQLGLIGRQFLWGIASVLTDGAVKYGAYNWRKGMDWNRPYDALQRHLTAWWDGEDLDGESGKSHLFHAACELMFLAEYQARGLGKDNRPSKVTE